MSQICAQQKESASTRQTCPMQPFVSPSQPITAASAAAAALLSMKGAHFLWLSMICSSVGPVFLLDSLSRDACIIKGANCQPCTSLKECRSLLSAQSCPNTYETLDLRQGSGPRSAVLHSCEKHAPGHVSDSRCRSFEHSSARLGVGLQIERYSMLPVAEQEQQYTVACGSAALRNRCDMWRAN